MSVFGEAGWGVDFDAEAGDTTPPAVSGVLPAELTELATTDAVQFDVTDDVLLDTVLVFASFGSSAFWELLHNDTAFAPGYSAGSTRTPISGGNQYVLKRDGGWPKDTALQINIIAFDAACNQTEVTLDYTVAASAVVSAPTVAPAFKTAFERAITEPLGCGVLRPVHRIAQGDFSNDCGEILVRSDLGQLLGIELWELPWRTDLGTGLSKLRHKSNSDAVAELARQEIETAIRRWERRVELLAVMLERPFTEPTLMQLRVRYRISTGEPREELIVL